MDDPSTVTQAKAVGVIPARWGSTRFPGKPLAKLRGKSLIQHVWERACRSRCLSRVVIATDDERIARHAQQFGATAVMTGPHHSSGTDRIVESLRQVADEAPYVVNIQGDEPLLDPSVIDRVVQALHEAQDCAASTAATAVTDRATACDPNRVKVVLAHDRRALYFSRSLIPFDRHPDDPAAGVFYLHLGLYAYRRRFLIHEWPRLRRGVLEERESLEQLRLLEAGYRMVVALVDEGSRGVDTPEDLVAMERLWSDAAG